jgi:hypothetical protein
MKGSEEYCLKYYKRSKSIGKVLMWAQIILKVFQRETYIGIPYHHSEFHVLKQINLNMDIRNICLTKLHKPKIGLSE